MSDLLASNDPRGTERPGVSGEGAARYDDIVDEATKRAERCIQYESTCRSNWLNDYKFAEADAYNGFQWPLNIRQTRELEDRPFLTINKTRQHCLQIINDAKQNKPSMKFRATGGGASYAGAQMLDGVARRIEYQSNASMAYDLATNFMVKAGFGWLRLRTKFVDSDSFDQDIYIEGVEDPLAWYLDCEATGDKLNARFGFGFEDMSRERAREKYGKWAEKATAEPIQGVGNWTSSDHVRVMEYYRREAKKDRLYAVKTPDGGWKTLRKSMLDAADPALSKALDADASVRWREVEDFTVHYHLIIGGHDVPEARSIWPGRYIPLIKVVAEERVIEGVYDCVSHTRALLDPQRMYNYWSSAAVEFGALQGKTPWITPIEAIEGYETYWRTANRVNHAYLPYNGLDDQGNTIAAPKRTDPPVAAPVCLEGMRIAQMEMMLVSGQYESVMGQGSNERSGKAINERQRAGENATYHFINGMGNSIRAMGKQVLDLIPRVYDTPRVLAMQAEDKTPFELMIDPQAAQSFQLQQQSDALVAQRILNPSIGKYEVEADIGPSYGTRRQEAFNAMTLILTQAPQLTAIIGDLLMRSADFPLADEAAERLRRMVPKYALGEGPSQNEQALIAQVQNLQELLAKSMEELSLEKIKLKGKEQLRDIDVFKALTDRIKVLADAAIKAKQAEEGEGEGGAGRAGELGEEELRALTQQAVSETLGASLQPILAANADEHEMDAGGQLRLPGIMAQQGSPGKAPLPGLKLAPNGRWYFPRDVSQMKTAIPLA